MANRQLTAAASSAAVETLVAGSVSHHDRAAFGAGRGIRLGLKNLPFHVFHLRAGFGSRRLGLGLLVFHLCAGFGSCLLGLRLLVAGQEFLAQPAEDVVHDGFSNGDLRIVGESGGFESAVAELVDQDFQWNPVLQSHGNGCGHGIHET